jgi:hypothetical protein
MAIPSSAYVPIGVIVAAIIGGGITFIVTVLAKDQKTSEFRQEWIDALRNDLAEMISLFSVLSDTFRLMSKAGRTEDEIFKKLTENNDIFCKLEMVNARIKLRINPTEHKKLLNAILRLREYIGSEQKGNSKIADGLVDEMVKESQVVLKNEWNRVKRGEPLFVVTEVVSLLLLGAAFLLGVWYALGTW